LLKLDHKRKAYDKMGKIDLTEHCIKGGHLRCIGMKKGPANTGATIEAALKRAGELNINRACCRLKQRRYTPKSSASGERGLKISCVTHHVGFTEPGEDEMPTEMRAKLGKKGCSCSRQPISWLAWTAPCGLNFRESTPRKS